MLLCIRLRGVGSMCCLPQPELIANAKMKYKHAHEQVQIKDTHMCMLFSMMSTLLRSSEE